MYIVPSQFLSSPTRLYESCHQSISLCHQQKIYLLQVQVNKISCLQNLLLVKEDFIISEDSFSQFIGDSGNDNLFSVKLKLRCMIMLLLMLSGNVQPNLGPNITLQCLPTPSHSKGKAGLIFVHLNVRCFVLKIDMIKIWANITNTDIMVLSETRLKKSVPDESISIEGYKVYRTDRVGKGDGVAIYVKSKFKSSVTLSVTKAKQFEVLAIKVGISNDTYITVVGCYRPPSASKDAFQSNPIFQIFYMK